MLVIGVLTLLLIVSVFLGRLSEKRLMFGVLGLLVVQGMLVHVGSGSDCGPSPRCIR